MNEQLQTALAELITSTLQAKEFIVGELPEVVRQLLVWKGIHNFVLFLIGLATSVVVIAIATKFSFSDDEDVFLRRIVVFSVCLMAAVFTLNIQWLKIWIAPKVWLIEYAASLVK